MFASPEGQQQVACQCMSRRVILICLNRGHNFGNLQVCHGRLSHKPSCLVVQPAPSGRFALAALRLLGALMQVDAGFNAVHAVGRTRA